MTTPGFSMLQRAQALKLEDKNSHIRKKKLEDYSLCYKAKANKPPIMAPKTVITPKPSYYEPFDIPKTTAFAQRNQISENRVKQKLKTHVIFSRNAARFG